jgi:hypothetical protein
MLTNCAAEAGKNIGSVIETFAKCPGYISTPIPPPTSPREQGEDDQSEQTR